MAYYRMVEARDCGGVQHLLIGHPEGNYCPRWWQFWVDYHVQATIASVRPYPKFPGDQVNYPQEQLVLASLHTRQIPSEPPDSVMEFLLVRHTDAEPWRIAEIGGMI